MGYEREEEQQVRKISHKLCPRCCAIRPDGNGRQRQNRPKNRTTTTLPKRMQSEESRHDLDRNRKKEEGEME